MLILQDYASHRLRCRSNRLIFSEINGSWDVDNARISTLDIAGRLRSLGRDVKSGNEGKGGVARSNDVFWFSVLWKNVLGELVTNGHCPLPTDPTHCRIGRT